MAAPNRRALVAGNWKMNGLAASLAEVEAMGRALSADGPPDCDVLICPPATLLAQMASAARQSCPFLAIGGQDCHAEESGAHTGDIAAEMLADAGASAVIVGHSERRQNHGEDDATVCAKAEAAHRAGLIAIICVGETLEEREAGKAADVVSRQLMGSMPNSCDGANTVVAYEPVWAIGSGLTPEPADIEDMHDIIRRRVATLFGVEAGYMRVLYGGSVKPDNARTILAIDHVDGALVGGASLRAVDFCAIVTTYQARQSA